METGSRQVCNWMRFLWAVLLLFLVLKLPSTMEKDGQKDAGSENFCDELRMKTKAVHDESDKLINLKIPAVLTDQRVWGQALARFYYVFQAIELALVQNRHHHHLSPVVRNLNEKVLFRTKAFERDLKYYLGVDWKENITKTEPVKVYCDRIWEVADKNPTLLIAYLHAMYLGLLSGGQILKRIVRKSLGISGVDGLAIFDFEDASKQNLKQTIKNTINDLDLDRQLKDEIISEKMGVFRMNNALVNDVKITWYSYSRIAKFIAFASVIAGLSIYVVFRMLFG